MNTTKVSYKGKFLQNRFTALLALFRVVAHVISSGAEFQSLAESIEKLDSNFLSLQVSFKTLFGCGLRLRLWFVIYLMPNEYFKHAFKGLLFSQFYLGVMKTSVKWPSTALTASTVDVQRRPEELSLVDVDQ